MKRQWWWYPAVAVLVVGAGVVFVVKNNGTVAEPAADPVAPATVSVTPSESVCLPVITETGFTVTGRVVHYGVVARNGCPEAIINGTVTTRILDSAGAPLAGQDEDLPELIVMLAGQQLAGAGTFYLDKADPVGRVEVAFNGATPAPATAFAAWPSEVRVDNLTVGRPDRAGRSSVTGRIVTDPAGAPLCSPAASLILRDHKGSIIYGVPGLIDSGEVTFELAVPAAADPARTAATIALGRGALSLDQAAAAACTDAVAGTFYNR